MAKILLVANTDWYLYNFRLSLANFLKENGFEVVFVSPAGQYASKLMERGFRHIEWKLNRKIGWPWNEAASLIRLSKVYARERPVIVHAHTLKVIFFCCFASFFVKKSALVNSVAGRGYIYSSKKGTYKLLSSILDRLFWLADKLTKPTWIFENQPDLDYFIQSNLISRNSVYLIESVGVDTDLYSFVPEPAGSPSILYAGRFLWSKGVGDIVDAVRAVRDQGQKVELVLVGGSDEGSPDSIEQPTLRDWEKLGFVTLAGWQEETALWYQRANIFAFPTKYGEGVPTVLLEAAASGRAIIATNHPGCMAVVKQGINGLLVPPNDIPALSNALSALLSDASLRAKMGRAGRDFVVSKYSKLAINQSTLNMYNNLLAKTGLRNGSS